MSTLQEDMERLSDAVKKLGVEFFKPFDKAALRMYKAGGMLKDKDDE